MNLYVVATPIGNLDDFSDRGAKTLQKVDAILCEDTRVTNKLLNKIGIKNKLIVYNDHNAEEVYPNVIKNIQQNNTVYALVSDAGTPLISDPGYKLINACINHNIKFTVIPGACAVINALILSGMPSDQFLFAGFANSKHFGKLSNINSTLIFYEAPQRVISTLKEMQKCFNNRTVAVVREMTKIFEEIVRGSFDQVIDHFTQNTLKGEFVIVLSSISNIIPNLQKYTKLISFMLQKFSINEVSKTISEYSGLSKNLIYNYIKSNHI